MDLPQKRYIGDGLDASHDGYQFWLEASNGERDSNRVALNQNTMNALDEYRKYALEHYKTEYRKYALEYKTERELQTDV